MSSNSEVILEQTAHAGDSTVETVTGEKFKGDGFYGRSDGVHTVQYAINNFAGTVFIQATLATNPSDEDWFNVYEQSYPVPDTDTSTTTNKIQNFTGNYVWVRAKVELEAGVVNIILLNH
jgi:hypothetical protein